MEEHRRKLFQPLKKTMHLEPIAEVFARAASFLLAASFAFALMINAAFYDAFPSNRLVFVLVAILLLHITLQPRVHYCREYSSYGAFVIYMVIQLLWTKDDVLAMNTIEPAVNFVIILILLGSLVTLHNLQAVFTGMLVGVLMGGLVYAVVVGFPFIYPPDFSYNAIAFMYLFGLFVTLLFGYVHGSKWWPILVSLMFVALTVATTSIKTNLGLLIGMICTLVLYFGFFSRVLARNLILLLALIGFLGFSIASNEAVVERLQNGVDRIALGIEILEARASISGYSGFEERSAWAIEGLRGWVQNPVFGHGVEAFRSRFGITSHSTAIDLMYNSGLIGFALFYSIFLSIMLRLRQAVDLNITPVCAVIFGTLVCFLFITMSGSVHTNYFLAAYIAISVGLLGRYRKTQQFTTVESKSYSWQQSSFDGRRTSPSF